MNWKVKKNISRQQLSLTVSSVSDPMLVSVQIEAGVARQYLHQENGWQCDTLKLLSEWIHETP